MTRSSVFHAAALLMLSPWLFAASAQDTGRDFLFRAPGGQLTIRGGYMTATANSDIFAFVKRHHTLSTGDFTGIGGDVEIGVSAGGRREFFFGAGYAGSRSSSEFRDWVDNNDEPIEQATLFERVPITAGLRYYVTERGKQVGNFAWIPNRYAVYAGAGVGAAWYRFQQSGDFIDHETLVVFSHTYESSGMAPLALLTTGVDYSLGPRMALNTQARYVWSSGALGLDYVGFNKIDLSGFSLAAGIHFRF